jgi:hypothetical protein
VFLKIKVAVVRQDKGCSIFDECQSHICGRKLNCQLFRCARLRGLREKEEKEMIRKLKRLKEIKRGLLSFSNLNNETKKVKDISPSSFVSFSLLFS